MENLKLYEAFGKGPANAVNPLFKKNFIDMATNAFGYTMRADKLTKDVDGVKCTIEVKDNGIKCDLIGNKYSHLLASLLDSWLDILLVIAFVMLLTYQ